jgi:hypothetical protein
MMVIVILFISDDKGSRKGFSIDLSFPINMIMM